MPTIRDWTYVAVVAVLLVTYAAGLVSKTVSASTTEHGSTCMITGHPPG